MDNELLHKAAILSHTQMLNFMLSVNGELYRNSAHYSCQEWLKLSSDSTILAANILM